ncbi:HAD family hydrolase [Sphaerisporangium rufum]|uniref:HAD family hydrolase n=1 Tax=Sphaerisporangium rufum TaxID=1381558 RepID=UPI00194E3023|nr:HAD family hydrolase [Sphaerisporangium rufum]
MSFDIDDTLIDYSASVPHSLRELFGPEADPGLWQALIDALYPRYLAGGLTHEAYLRTRLAAMLTALGRPVPGAAGLDELERRRRTAAESRLRLYPDVPGCLAALREAGLPLALLSNADGPRQRRRLDVVGLTGLFDAIVISGESGVAKPDPAAFGLVRARLGVDHVVHVGDDPAADARGALGAGFLPVLVDRAGRTRAVPPGVLRVGDLRAVPALLEHVGRGV